METRDYCFFEWVIIDNCNLHCSYCVNKGKTSQKSKSSMSYTHGTEVVIAEQISILSKSFKKVVVNLTGGEPTTAGYLLEALTILGGNNNIKIQMVSNLKDLKTVESVIHWLFNVIVSLHVTYRSDKEIIDLANFINKYKHNIQFTLSQVDYNLSQEDIRKLSIISEQTGLQIYYQTYIPPIAEDGDKDAQSKLADRNFVSSLGKRCSLGYFCFLIGPNGIINYDLWCDNKTAIRGDLLSKSFNLDTKFILDDMRLCPNISCGCNYNIINYDMYIKACGEKGYPKNEIFLKENRRLSQVLLRKITSLKVLAMGKVSVFVNKLTIK